jgi:hypothetical protein
MNLKDFAALRVLYDRWWEFAEITERWQEIMANGEPDARWISCPNQEFCKVGNMLLYRLQDAGAQEGKLQLLQDLPTQNLACLIFILTSTFKMGRFHGAQQFRGYLTHEDLEAASSWGVSLEEALLINDPKVHIGMLKAEPAERRTWAIRYVISGLVSAILLSRMLQQSP